MFPGNLYSRYLTITSYVPHLSSTQADQVVIAHSSSADLIPGSYPSSEYPLSSVELRNLSATSSETLDLSLPSTPLVFSGKYYHGLSAVEGDWSSAYLPEGWYGLVKPGLALWGSIPNRGELRNLPPKSKSFMEVAYGMSSLTTKGTRRLINRSMRTGVWIWRELPAFKWDWNGRMSM